MTNDPQLMNQMHSMMMNDPQLQQPMMDMMMGPGGPSIHGVWYGPSTVHQQCYMQGDMPPHTVSHTTKP